MTSRRRRSVLVAGTAAGALLMVVGSATVASADLRYYTTSDVRLNVRSGPGTSYNITRTLPGSSKVVIYCQMPGTTVTGTYGTTNIWDNISNGEFVSDAYVNTGSDGYVASRCA
ncbi:hypothetical protein ACFV0T_08565 [Streptomyces sp. NPDC059582]|uniref:hypothetical protein n=1 Tax=Streptomyces sp. NPDC059582 TaxID=3346875 RepID=UPI00368FBB01